MSPAPARRDSRFVPDEATVSASQLTAFVRFCEARTGRRFADSAAFHDFSVKEHPSFWSLLLGWSDLMREGSPEPVCTDAVCERAAFFPDLRLSYVENLLRTDAPAEADLPALIAVHASRPTERLSRRELRDRVLDVAASLRRLGLAEGDRVAAVAGNNAEVVVAALATAEVGATFSSAAPDMGTAALLSRFEQLAPKVLFVNLAGAGEGATATPPERTAELARGLPALAAVVALDDGPAPPGLTVPIHRLSELAVRADDRAADLPPTRYAFNHPLFILFTSGTTGRPKCIVHGAGGTLLEHVKEHRLHCDIRSGDTLFFHTSAAWMMWNWQLSALASGSAIVVYDGPLTGPETLWGLVSEERVTVFGTSPSYLQLCEDSGFSPGRELDLGSLRAVLSTGSILHDWQYDWVRDHVGALPLQSISGGTDIVGCFVLGNPNLPVHRGWIQSRSLGLDVQAVPTATTPAGSGVGELICRNPFPSRPLGLLGDDGRAFHAAYFEQNPPAWTHGDLIELDDAGQARMHGRSDGVINIQGVRIGPADIYRALRGVPEVSEAVAVEQQADDRGRSRLVLLVVLREPATLDGALTVRIRREIARQASPIHVPELIVAVSEVPVTHSGKRSERAARDAVNGMPAINTEALSNPGSLEEIRRATELAAERLRGVARAPQPALEASTEARLLPIWESVLGVAPLRPDDDFFDLGGTSLTAVRLFQAIYDVMGVELPLSSLIYARTPATLAAVIDGPAEHWGPPLVAMRPGTAGRPVFVLHTIEGDVLAVRQLSLALRTDRPVYGLQARGLNPRENPQDRVEEMAAAQVETIRSVQSTGPYTILGYSFGGLVAFEVARVLAGEGDDVDWLGLLDPRVHPACLPLLARWRSHLGRPLRLLQIHAGVRTRVARYREVGIAPWARLDLDPPPFTPLQRRVMELGIAAFDAYRPGPYEGTATYIGPTRAAIGPDRHDPRPVWRRVVRGGLTEERVHGDHFDIVNAPAVQVLAAIVDASLDRAP